MKRRFEITAVKRQRIVRHSVLTHCPLCQAHSELLTTTQAAALAQVDLSSINGWLNEGALHGATTPDGQWLICKNSLVRFGPVKSL
jgi:hypothetical protein